MKEKITKVQFTAAEAEEMGYFNVESILSHKFKFGAWRFLVKWQGFPASAASWEGVKSFRLPGGRWNSIFVKFLQENGLEGILQKENPTKTNNV